MFQIIYSLSNVEFSGCMVIGKKNYPPPPCVGNTTLVGIILQIVDFWFVCCFFSVVRKGPVLSKMQLNVRCFFNI